MWPDPLTLLLSAASLQANFYAAVAEYVNVPTTGATRDQYLLASDVLLSDDKSSIVSFRFVMAAKQVGRLALDAMLRNFSLMLSPRGRC